MSLTATNTDLYQELKRVKNNGVDLSSKPSFDLSIDFNFRTYSLRKTTQQIKLAEVIKLQEIARISLTLSDKPLSERSPSLW